jgi:AraC-like DNA-binding protein
MGSGMEDELGQLLRVTGFVEHLFDRLPEVVFFVKDTAARYAMVNQTLVERCGVRDKAALLGRTTRDLFPAPLGSRFLSQDLQVLDSGRTISDRLELHLYAGGDQGWCLTDKSPLVGDHGRIIGLAGTSRDLRMPDGIAGLEELAETVELMQTRYAEPLRVEDLAARAGLSVYRFARRIREIFQLTPAQLIGRIRVDAACHLLRTSDAAVAAVAQRCGYCDQSAFTRHFKSVCGLTPTQYRRLLSGD